jgi:hypothetical protein
MSMTGLLLMLFACGGAEAPVAPLPPEPIPVVVPPWVLGRWIQTQAVDGREVIAWPCQGEPLSLEIVQSQALVVRGPAGDQEHPLTMAELQRDGSARLVAATGELVLHDRDEGLVFAKGSLPGFESGIRLAVIGASAVEQLPPGAASCGQPLDLQPLHDLGERRFNQAGDPCSAPGLLLPAPGGAPLLQRAGLELRIEGLRANSKETWLAVQTSSGSLSGMRLAAAEGGLVLHQRTAAGMRSERLLPASGPCRP